MNNFPFVPVRRRVAVDTECVRNYWLLKAKCLETGQIWTFDQWPADPAVGDPGRVLDAQGLMRCLAQWTIITFNGMHYDLPMITYALTGADCNALKEANDCIIRGTKSWDFYRTMGIEPPDFIDHIDIFEVAPGVRISLKTYMGAVHSTQMQDLPFDPAAWFTMFDRVETSAYCVNDVNGTIDLYRAVENRVKLREALNKQYGHEAQRNAWLQAGGQGVFTPKHFDVRSKSDAQIAEAIFKHLCPTKVYAPFIPHGFQFTYEPAPFVEFETEQLRNVLQIVTTAPFTVSDKEQAIDDFDDDEEIEKVDKIKTGIVIPPEIKRIRIAIGGSKYKFGMGGLHSQEKAVNYVSIPGDCEISDHDVTSYYPSLILILAMFPPALGAQFLVWFQGIYDQRVHAKKMGQECHKRGDVEGEKYWNTIAEGLKIVLNGTFGKLGSKYSILFSPQQMIRVTLTGQLALLMLIEQLEKHGISVISANTDGIVLRTPEGLQSMRDSIISEWTRKTALTMEMTRYDAIYMQSVNSYVAFKPDGEVKTVGAFAKPGVTFKTKLPAAYVKAEAVIAFLADGTPLSRTIRLCTDMRKFVTVRNVSGGGYKPYLTGPQRALIGTQHEPFEIVPMRKWLGKVVRYYWSTQDPFPILYCKNDHKVPLSEHSTEAMRLPDAMPDDIDYERYEAEARKLLKDVGVEIA